MPANNSLTVSQPDDNDVTAQQREAFLAYIRGHRDCSTREACDHVGIRRKDVKALKAADSEFAADYREARGYGNDTIRNALRDRAIDGVEEPIVSVKGEIVGSRRVYSDRLLEFLARMHLPEAKALQAHRFGVEVTGAGGGPVEIQQGVSLADVAAVLHRAGALPGALPAVGAGDARPALPAASEVLAEPSNG